MKMLISIHSPHTRGDPSSFPSTEALKISIHSPHTRGDAGGTAAGRSCPKGFQSTPLTRGETGRRFDLDRVSVISIHSPHTRGDLD